MLLVRKYPDPQTCAQTQELPDDHPLVVNPPAGWEAMSREDFELWRAAQPPIEPAAPELGPIPWAISNADLRRTLIERGINPANVLAWLNSLPEGPEKWSALNDWEYSNYYERGHPMLNDPTTLALFGLTNQDVDEMFLSKPAYPPQG